MLELADLAAARSALRRRLQLVQGSPLISKVIVIVNGKGGVGKSSTAAAFAAALAKLGLKVLLAELDEQGNNAEDLGFTGGPLDDGGRAQAAAILDGKPLVPTGEARPNLFVLPGGPALEEVVEELYCQRRAARHTDDLDEQAAWTAMYAAAIDAVADDYDVIILDVAPGCEPLQLQALVAGHRVLIPTKSDPSSRKGLRTVARRFAQAVALNPVLRLLGVIIFATNSSATRVQEDIKSQLSADLRGAAPVFEQTIRHVEAAAVTCRKLGKVPQELRLSKTLEPAARRSMSALAGDYQSLAIEVMQAKAAMDQQQTEELAA
ncbi:ParA family protein [Streptomyces vietnamensis]|uniref:ParA family protein n=1 Tax=Streptomyces vietnamensis TaxID=362257 RepID=UPI000A931B05|nr:ParA family protein [Streptomyces vietnamensis]